MQVAGIVEQSFTAWHGRASAVVYFAGSPYPKNCWHYPVLERYPLAVRHSSNDLEKALRAIEEQVDRKRITAIVLGGAEPLLQQDLPEFCRELKKLRLEVRLETFGSNPKLLRELLDAKLADFVSLRVKSVFAKYKELFGSSGEPVKESYALLASSGVTYEVCVTPVPEVVEEKELRLTVWNVQESPRLVIEQFDPSRCVEKQLKTARKPTVDELVKLASSLQFHGLVFVRAEGREAEVQRMAA
ncbi:radical SAM protein [Candidatus Micrarchaeota archaeon]|nr:radical SAM protein [Candidatus Micrarchaeota archaeon]